MKKQYLLVALLFVMLFTQNKTSAQILPTGLGAYNVTAAADTLAKIYVDYVEKDIDIYFFARFDQLLKNNPELRTLFPSTTLYLNDVPSYQYTNMLTALRTAFFKDMKALPKGIAEIANIDTSSCCINAKNPISCIKNINELQAVFNSPQGRLAIASLYIADGAINKVYPATIIENIAKNLAIANGTDDLSGVIKLINALSTALKNEEGNNWVSLTDFNKNPDLYITAFLENMKNPQIFIQGHNITATAATLNSSTNFKKYVDSLITIGSRLNNNFDLLRTNDTSNSTKLKNLVVFIQDLQLFFKNAADFPEDLLPKGEQKVAIVQAKRIFTDVNNGLELAKDILTKDYKGAVFAGIVLIDSLIPTNGFVNRKGRVNVPKTSLKKVVRNRARQLTSITSPDAKFAALRYKEKTTSSSHLHQKHQLKKEIRKMDKLVAAEEKEKTRLKSLSEQKATATSIETSRNNISSLHNAFIQRTDSVYHDYMMDTSYATVKSDTEAKILRAIKFKQNYLKYSMLLADVVQADNSAQIVTAIEKAANPPGTSIIKKTTNFSISLQGYAGLSAGSADRQFNNNVFQSFNTINPYAPLGVAFSFGLKARNMSNKNSKGSLSLFFSVIDIGAIVAYDLNKSTSTTHTFDTTTIKLANIFAPGVNLVYGIPGVPLSVGTGFQYLPMLQTKLGSGTPSDPYINTTKPATRWQLFVAFDLSFFDLYVSKR